MSRRSKKHRQNYSDALWSRPMTPEGADVLARRHGYRFAGLVDPMATPPLRAFTEATVAGFRSPGARFMAEFVPEPDDGRGVVFADGRTLNRALRRGLEGVHRLSKQQKGG